jgi:hypothetical protein
MRGWTAFCVVVLSLLGLYGVGTAVFMVLESMLHARASPEREAISATLAFAPGILGAISLAGSGVIVSIYHNAEKALRVAEHTLRAVEALKGPPPAGNTSAPYAS